MKKRNLLHTIIGILIPLAAGALAARLARDGMALYMATAQKPPLSPPAWVFPVAWTILFVLMGIASVRVRAKVGLRSSAIRLYVLQLFVNFLWPLLFFRWQAYLFSFIWLLLLLVLVLRLFDRFREVDALAGKLLIPYLIWLIFAAYLNFYAYLLNS